MAHIETILLAIDGSPASEPASQQAIDLACQVEARLLVVSVLAASSRPSEASAGAAATCLVWEGEPGEAIVAASDSENVDLIVVGSHGRGSVGRFFIGSVSDYVVRHAHCPVMVVRGGREATRH